MIADRLFLELLFVAAALLGILLINNIFLYKQKLNNLISLMLISGIAMCGFEIMWSLVDGHANLRIPAYVAICCYCVAFLVFGVIINLYLMDRIGIRLGKIRYIIFYAVPVSLISLLCITSPWSHLLFLVDEGGMVQTKTLFDTLFQGIVYIYIFSPLLIALYFRTVGKKKGRLTVKSRQACLCSALWRLSFTGYSC